ncbi:MAG TPA: hypothetical protein VGH34_00415 [Vicinamibacterales bacterium]|jgi:hypothetical protein
MGALTEHHRCPRGPLHRLGDALSTVGIGGAIGVLVCWMLDDHALPALYLAAAALGGVLASAVRQAVGGRS